MYVYLLQVVSFGTDECGKNSWLQIYDGYAMAPHRAVAGVHNIGSSPICVDQEPEPTTGAGQIIYPDDVTHPRAPDYSFIRSNSVFDQLNRLVPCVVCANG